MGLDPSCTALMLRRLRASRRRLTYAQDGKFRTGPKLFGAASLSARPPLRVIQLRAIRPEGKQSNLDKDASRTARLRIRQIDLIDNVGRERRGKVRETARERSHHWCRNVRFRTDAYAARKSQPITETYYTNGTRGSSVIASAAVLKRPCSLQTIPIHYQFHL